MITVRGKKFYQTRVYPIWTNELKDEDKIGYFSISYLFALLNLEDKIEYLIFNNLISGNCEIMADNQVLTTYNLAWKILPKTRKCVLEQQEIVGKKDQLWSQILQECWSWIQDP